MGVATVKDTGCCKPFEPKKWDGKTVVWKDKLFVADHVRSFLHIPLNFGSVMKRDMDAIFKANAQADEPLCLSDESSLWGSDIFIAVKKPVAGLKTTRLSGTFLCKVFSGPYSDAGKWAKQMQEYVRSKGKTAKKTYFFYTMCPACAKAYGQNYTVLVAQVG